tara:strand:+ start:182 stop:415 length:234 start_codon:yes stop_codon:yes gene_type:complete
MIDKISMNLIEGLKMKIDALEKLSHELQNYKDKCDEMEKRLERIEVLTKVNTVIDVEERLSKLENIIITNMIDEEER